MRARKSPALFLAILGVAVAFATRVVAQVDTLNGVVRDSSTNAMIPLVTVASEGISVDTKSDGTFTLVLPVGDAIFGPGPQSAPRILWNPETSSFTWPGVTGAVSIRILDFSGRVARRFAGTAGAEGFRFSIADLPAGVYTASLTGMGRTLETRLAKRAASGKSHDLTFTKAGYGAKTQTVPAGTSSNALITVKLAKEKGGLESLQVGPDAPVTGKVVLDSGELFLLKASGVISVSGQSLDAEFIGAAGGAAKDSVNSEDVGLDFGLKTVRKAKLVPLVPGRMKWFGPYRADHVYHAVVEGNGKPLTLKVVRVIGDALATGSINVTVTRLSPAPPQVGPEIDTVHAHLYKDTTHTHITTAVGTVYLLQCDGQGKVGGARLGMGDAENMDYDANGGGLLDVGDANTDYGLGVDEIFPGKAANTLTPRKNWWGNFRKDHIYYQLFAGTGKPIAFEFYDSGYGDNAKDAFLTVRVFAVP